MLVPTARLPTLLEEAGFVHSTMEDSLEGPPVFWVGGCLKKKRKTNASKAWAFGTWHFYSKSWKVVLVMVMMLCCSCRCGIAISFCGCLQILGVCWGKHQTEDSEFRLIARKELFCSVRSCIYVFVPRFFTALECIESKLRWIAIFAA